MGAFFESRLSDSPYIEIIWRGHADRDYAPVCPADAHWHLLFFKQGRVIRASAEDPLTQSLAKYEAEEQEFLVIVFKLGVFMPHLPASELVNTDAVLTPSAGRSFWLQGDWQLPTFENAEGLVSRLAKYGIISEEPVVDAVLQGESPDISARTVRRRFLHTTGLTPKTIQQIDRAQKAATMLGRGVPILDVVFDAGYADQPHLTHSLKRFYGQTPSQIMAAAATG